MRAASVAVLSVLISTPKTQSVTCGLLLDVYSCLLYRLLTSQPGPLSRRLHLRSLNNLGSRPQTPQNLSRNRPPKFLPLCPHNHQRTIGNRCVLSYLYSPRVAYSIARSDPQGFSSRCPRATGTETPSREHPSCEIASATGPSTPNTYYSATKIALTCFWVSDAGPSSSTQWHGHSSIEEL